MKELTPRQKEIVNISIELIAEKSIQGLTIKNLSQKLGLTEGAIYRHFNSKFDILLTILASFQKEADEILNSICTSEKSAMKHIENIFNHHFKRFSEKPAITSVIFSESIFQNDSRLTAEVFKLLHAHEEVLKCIIESGQKSGEFRNDVECNVLVRMIIGSIRYTVTKWRLTHFEFDLIPEGRELLNNIKKLIIKDSV